MFFGEISISPECSPKDLRIKIKINILKHIIKDLAGRDAYTSWGKGWKICPIRNPNLLFIFPVSMLQKHFPVNGGNKLEPVKIKNRFAEILQYIKASNEIQVMEEKGG